MAGELSPFHFGFYYNEDRDKVDRTRPLDYDGERHILLFGVNGAGKSTRILIENLVAMWGRSIVVFDMKGELAAQTHRARRRWGDVYIINPYDLHNLGSDGYNPLSLLDPADDEFFDKAKLLTEAVIESEGESNPYFPRSARGWFCAGIMWEVVEARREGRAPSLLRAREWCLQPDMWGPAPDDAETEILVAGVTVNAKQAVAEGGRQIANLAARFARDKLERGDHDILSTLATETEFLVSAPIANDLEKGEWSLAQLRQEPTTVYIVLPPQQVQDKRAWTRMLMTAALSEHLKTGPVRTWFIMDEFRVAIGHLPIVNDFWALVRGYGVQFLPVAQSVTQLRALFGPEWENYAGQAECVATIGPPGDMETAEWMSRRGGMRSIWQEGWSTNEGTNPYGGVGRTTAGESRSQVARPHRLPQELMNMRVGSGRIWLAGMGDRAVPYYAPNYWQRAEIEQHVDISPYYNGPVQPLKRSRSDFDQFVFRLVREGVLLPNALNASRRVQMAAISRLSPKTCGELRLRFIRARWDQLLFRVGEFARNPLRTLKTRKQARRARETRWDRFVNRAITLAWLAVFLLAASIFTVDMVQYGASARVSAEDTFLKMAALAKYIGLSILLYLVELIRWIKGGG